MTTNATVSLLVGLLCCQVAAGARVDGDLESDDFVSSHLSMKNYDASVVKIEMELDTATAMVSRATAGIIEPLSYEIPAAGAINMASWCTKACSSNVFGHMFEEEHTEGVDLYKGSFSLADGTLTLLHDTKMQLKCNRFYGLLGPNQCGKTTLIRAIVNEPLEGFPKRDELKSIFAEHKLLIQPG